MFVCAECFGAHRQPDSVFLFLFFFSMSDFFLLVTRGKVGLIRFISEAKHISPRADLEKSDTKGVFFFFCSLQ